MNPTISVVIPCVHEHVQHLDRVLSSYDDNTLAPSEIVISVSNSHLVADDKLDEIARRHPKQKVVYIRLPHPASPSDNRNIGGGRATGDVIVYQDADDTAHPQRLEAIAHCFRTHDILHLVHFWQPSAPPFPVYEIEKLVCQRVVFRKSLLSGPYVIDHNGPTLAGAPAVRRQVLDRVKWPAANEQWGEDYYFNFACLQTFNKSMVLEASLYKYFKF